MDETPDISKPLLDEYDLQEDIMISNIFKLKP